MTAQTDLVRHSRLTLLLLGALFFAPLVGAWVLYYYFPELRPPGTTNHGQLISPARPVPALRLVGIDAQALDSPLKGKWTLVYLGAERCDESCAQRLVLIRQVRLALGKDLARVARLYIAPDETARAAVAAQLTSSHPGLIFAADAGAAGARARDFFGAGPPDAVYLVDPNGNWLMVYGEQLEPKDLLDDLKQLLRLSNIG